MTNIELLRAVPSTHHKEPTMLAYRGTVTKPQLLASLKRHALADARALLLAVIAMTPCPACYGKGPEWGICRSCRDSRKCSVRSFTRVIPRPPNPRTLQRWVSGASPMPATMVAWLHARLPENKA